MPQSCPPPWHCPCAKDRDGSTLQMCACPVLLCSCCYVGGTVSEGWKMLILSQTTPLSGYKVNKRYCFPGRTSHEAFHPALTVASLFGRTTYNWVFLHWSLFNRTNFPLRRNVTVFVLDVHAVWCGLWLKHLVWIWSISPFQLKCGISFQNYHAGPAGLWPGLCPLWWCGFWTRCCVLCCSVQILPNGVAEPYKDKYLGWIMIRDEPAQSLLCCPQMRVFCELREIWGRIF